MACCGLVPQKEKANLCQAESWAAERCSTAFTLARTAGEMLQASGSKLKAAIILLRSVLSAW